MGLYLEVGLYSRGGLILRVGLYLEVGLYSRGGLILGGGLILKGYSGWPMMHLCRLIISTIISEVVPSSVKKQLEQPEEDSQKIDTEEKKTIK